MTTATLTKVDTTEEFFELLRYNGYDVERIKDEWREAPVFD